YPIVIPPTTKTLSAGTVNNLSSVSPDGNIYTFSQTTAELDKVSIGDIIVSDVTDKAPNGFLKRVKNITRNNGQVVVETDQASLDEAIQSGAIKLHKKLTPADVAHTEILIPGHAKLAAPRQASGSFYIEKNDIVIYDKDQDQSTQLDQVRMNLKYEFEPDLVFEMSIHDFTLQKMRFEVDTTQTKTVEFEYGLKQGFENVNGNDINVEIARYYLNPITIPAGIPVVIVPIITVVAGLDGDVHAGVTMSLTRTETTKNGLAYEHQDGWQKISEHSENFGFSPPTLVPDVGWDIQGYTGPRLTLMLYGLAGPYSSLRFYLEWEHNGLGVSSWYAGLGVDVGVKMKILSHTLVDKSEQFEGYRVLLNPQDTAIPAITSTITIAPTTLVPITYVPPGVTITPINPAPITPIPPGPYTNSSTVMLFDVSASMEEQDSSGSTKLDAAKGAGGRILDIIQAENSAGQGADMGILSFSDSAAVNFPLSTDVNAARSALDGLATIGRTGMPDGLRLAIDQFKSAKGSKPIIIMLSDGMPNIGLGNNYLADEDTIRQQVLDLASEAGGKGICIYTVGFGVPNSVSILTGASINEDFLKQVSAKSGCGAYYNAQNATDLANVYVSLRHQSTGNIVFQKTGDIAQGQTVDIGAVPVPQGQNELLVTLNWPGSRLDPGLVDPGGKTVDKNYPGATFFQSKSLASVIVQNPPAGNWKLSATGVDVPEGKTVYNAVASTRFTGVATPQPPPDGGSPIALVIIFLAVCGLIVYAAMVTTRRNRQFAVAGDARMVGLAGQLAGNSLPVTDNYLIGRGRECQVQLSDRAVSRQHARIRYAGGRWYIQDLKSAGGTYLNGVKVSAAPLNPGDRIRVGSSEFEFKG
ncbi:MAG: FHA domain-containing protein, partial [Anaerolineales bacterium]